MFSVPDGRAANHPSRVTTFSPPMGMPLPGASVKLATIGSPASSEAPTCSGESFSSTAFYPLDGLGFGDSGNDDRGMQHNFHFTTEIHTAFQYQGGETFSFTGDDDVWVYINNQLVIDLGGVHVAQTAAVQVDTLGLTPGQVYPFDMFQTERHTTQSNFRADTTLTFVNCGTIVSGEPK